MLFILNWVTYTASFNLYRQVSIDGHCYEGHIHNYYRPYTRTCGIIHGQNNFMDTYIRL